MLPWKLALASLLVAVPLAGSAATIELVSIYRSTSASATPGWDTSTTGTDFDESTSAAGTLRSSAGFTTPYPAPLGGNSMGGLAQSKTTIASNSMHLELSTYQGSGDYASGSVEVEALVDLTFDLTVDSSYNVFAVALRGLNTTRIALFDESGTAIIDDDGLIGAATLYHGRYRLLITTQYSGPTFFEALSPNSASSLFDASFNFTPIPEPASASLLAFGLAALAARSRVRA